MISLSVTKINYSRRSSPYLYVSPISRIDISSNWTLFRCLGRRRILCPCWRTVCCIRRCHSELSQPWTARQETNWSVSIVLRIRSTRVESHCSILLESVQRSTLCYSSNNLQWIGTGDDSRKSICLAMLYQWSQHTGYRRCLRISKAK